MDVDQRSQEQPSTQQASVADSPTQRPGEGQKERADLVRILNAEILSPKGVSADKQHACVQTLLKLTQNVLNNPSEDKFRKIRASNASVRDKVLAVKGGEAFLVHSGWRKKVVEFEGWYTLGPEATDLAEEARHLLAVAADVLTGCLKVLQEKVQRMEKERWEQKHGDSMRREELQRKIAGDKVERRAAHAERVAGPAPGASGASGASGEGTETALQNTRAEKIPR